MLTTEQIESMRRRGHDDVEVRPREREQQRQNKSDPYGQGHDRDELKPIFAAEGTTTTKRIGSVRPRERQRRNGRWNDNDKTNRIHAAEGMTTTVMITFLLLLFSFFFLLPPI